LDWSTYASAVGFMMVEPFWARADWMGTLSDTTIRQRKSIFSAWEILAFIISPYL
jgi:hypothetical protein